MTSVWRLGGVRGVSAIVAGGALVVAFAVAVLPADAAVSGVVRVDQVGYLAGESKQAYLMASETVPGARFAVIDPVGATVLSGAVGATSRGSWNTAHPAVYPISFDALTRPGTYRIQVSGGASARSPKFKILDPAGLYGKLVADRYATAHRPVFRAAEPGTKISPNLAGRVSAAFALAAQVDAERDRARATAAFHAATSIYAQAATADPPTPLVTALPNAFYPERAWHDDMEFGAAEIALAAQKLGKDGSAYLADAATFARGYLDRETGDTFNLYDTSALAHADLIEALRNAGNPSGAAVTATALVTDLKRQVRGGADRAASDVFRAGGDYSAFDVNSHTFGLLTTEALYRRVTGDTSFAAVATQQRNWLLGGNAWGTSFMIGEGTTFPRCPHHQISNLRAGATGPAPVLTGAVVNGPNDSRLFAGGLGGHQAGMAECPPSGNGFNAFTGHKSRYADDVRSWQTSEPAIDMTGSAVIGAAMQQAVAIAGNGADYSVALSAPTVSLPPEGSATLTVATGSRGGPLVTLAVTGMPEGVVVALAPVVVLAGTSVRMTLTALSTAAPGTYPLTVTATSPGLKARTATVKLTIG